MITITIGHKVSDGNLNGFRLTSPLGTPDEDEDLQRRFYPEPLQSLRRQLPGYHVPLVYAYRKREVFDRWEVTDSGLHQVEEERWKVRLIRMFMPLDDGLPALAMGESTYASRGLVALHQALDSHGIQTPLFKPVTFNLNMIREHFPDSQWYRRSNKAGHVDQVTLRGTRVEKDEFHTHLDTTGALDQQMGVTVQVAGRELRVKVLSSGRLQFFDFNEPSVLSRDSEKHGDPWPAILEAIQKLLSCAE